MTTDILDIPVGRLVAERPSRSRIFERLGIDYCCGGQWPRRESCERRGLDADVVLHELASCELEPSGDETDWTRTPMGALADHIVAVHHQYLRNELPRLGLLLGKVVNAHADRHPELRQLQAVFTAFRSDLELHMDKEERVLFPLCRALETAGVPPDAPCGSIKNPIHRMVVEHEDAGEALAAMRKLTRDFTPPSDACVTYQTLLESLAELERDMRLHVHEKNNILFPRAAAAEEALSPRVG